MVKIYNRAKKLFISHFIEDEQRVWNILSVVAILTIFILAILKAISPFDPLNYDEAYTVDVYFKRPINIFKRYLANNHIMHSFLGAIIVRIIGYSQLAVRVPALISGLFMTSILYVLSIFMFKKRIYSLFTILFIGFNPIIFQFFFMARGYATAFAFYIFSVIFLIMYLYEFDKKHRKLRLYLKFASVGFAFAVLTNLSLLFISLSTIFSFCLLLILKSRFLKSEGSNFTMSRSEIIKHIRLFILPGLIIFTIPMIWILPPILKNPKKYFYVGSEKITGFLTDIGKYSIGHYDFWHHHNLYPYPDNTHNIFGITIPDTIFYTIVFVLFIAIIFILILSTILGITIFVKKYREKKYFNNRELIYIFFILTNVVFITTYIIANKLFGIQYPAERVGFYYIVFLSIIMISTIYFVNLFIRKKLVTILSFLVLSVVISHFIFQFSSNFSQNYIYYDKGNRKNLDYIYEVNSDKNINVANRWPFMSSYNYYRQNYDKYSNIETHMVLGKLLNEDDFSSNEVTNMDYFLLYSEYESDIAEEYNLELVYKTFIHTPALYINRNKHPNKTQ